MEYAGEEGAAEAVFLDARHEPSHEVVAVALLDEGELLVVEAEETVGGYGGAAQWAAGDDSSGKWKVGGNCNPSSGRQ